MKTLEQLNKMTDYEISCAAAEKIGLKLHAGFRLSNGDVYIEREIGCNYNATPFYTMNYCSNPSDYMPIAIEHGIDLHFSACGYDVQACGYKNKDFSSSSCWSGYLPKAQTGRAVCIAYLLTEV